jgi:uncharacterized protein (TIGR02246 family)
MDQTNLKALIDSRSHAIQAKDLDRLMSHYSPDIVYFDIVPPLQYVGTAALRERFSDWFAAYSSGIRQDIRDLNIRMSGDLAVTSMLIQSGGTTKSGHEVSLLVRATTSFQRSSGTWLITHEHISLPVDLRSGKAVMGGGA